jgi:hypothetical protein
MLQRLGETQGEFDVTITGSGSPAHPPLDIGWLGHDGQWQQMKDKYHPSVHCRVRSQPVRFSMWPDGFKPAAPYVYEPWFDEDSSADEQKGTFAHPIAGVVPILHSGVGLFSVAFEYGKFVYPRWGDRGVDVLAPAVMGLFQDAFRTDFCQACHWS